MSLQIRTLTRLFFSKIQVQIVLPAPLLAGCGIAEHRTCPCRFILGPIAFHILASATIRADQKPNQPST